MPYLEQQTKPTTMATSSRRTMTASPEIRATVSTVHKQETLVGKENRTVLQVETDVLAIGTSR